MFKRTLALLAIVGMAFTANASTAMAKSNSYKTLKVAAWGGVPIFKIRQKLRHRGYRRIQFTDRWLPVYKARACKHGKRYKLNINRWGKVMWRSRIGWCGGRYQNKFKHRKHY